jgi:hypothetical protein
VLRPSVVAIGGHMNRLAEQGSRIRHIHGCTYRKRWPLTQQCKPQLLYRGQELLPRAFTPFSGIIISIISHTAHSSTRVKPLESSRDRRTGSRGTQSLRG